MKKYNFVYQTKNLINNKLYIGVHKTDKLNDGYIGCGVSIKSPKQNNTPFQKAVQKYGKENFKLEILSFYDTYEECLEEEKFLVDILWVKDKNNYNVTTGGKQFLFPEEHFNNISRNIFQFDLYGNLIKEWQSTTEIFNQLGFNKDCITECCRGDKGFYKHFQWSYDNNCEMYYSNRSYRTIYQYTLKGEYIRCYLNAIEAQKLTNTNASHISNNCNNYRNTISANGFRWSYSKLEFLPELNKLPKSINKKFKVNDIVRTI